MSDENHPPPPSNGLFAPLQDALAGAARLFEIRLRLASLEGKEAGAHIARCGALVFGATLFVAWGILLLTAGGIWILDKATGISWEILAVVAGILFVAGGVGTLFFVRSRFARPVFQETLNQFKKDSEWLKNPSRHGR